MIAHDASPPTARLNHDVARRLEEAAELLREQHANPFRIQAYRNAARTLRALPESVEEILGREGMNGLRRLPAIGDSIARSIRDLLATGRLPVLDRLRGDVDPVALLETVPGVGRASAERMVTRLGIETLEALEAAAHDGRLTEFLGIGGKRLAGIIDTLSARLNRVRQPPSPSRPPPLAELLDVDDEYRRRAAEGRLPRIAPRRFNPEGKAWLPVLHTERGDRHYTALYSNTAKAHRLGRTHDWVVLYFDGGTAEHQCTVITSQWGLLRDRRIVRGREGECMAHYGIGRTPAGERPGPP